MGIFRYPIGDKWQLVHEALEEWIRACIAAEAATDREATMAVTWRAKKRIVEALSTVQIDAEHFFGCLEPFVACGAYDNARKLLQGMMLDCPKDQRMWVRITLGVLFAPFLFTIRLVKMFLP